MSLLAASRWTAVTGAFMSVLILWALFVVPSGPRWAGAVWFGAVGVMAVMATVLGLSRRLEPTAHEALLGERGRAGLLVPAPARARARRWR